MTSVRSFGVVACVAAGLACGGGETGGDGGAGREVVVRGMLAQSQAFAVPSQVSFALQWMGAAYADPIVNDANRDPAAPDPQFVSACEQVVPYGGFGCDGTPTSGRERCRIEDVLATALLEPVRYEARFPISFAVPMPPAPPAAALYDLAAQGGRGVFAMATVLAFLDGDGDGALRLGTPGVAGERGLANSAFQDYLPEGGAPRLAYFVTYLDGTIAPSSIFPAYAEVLLHVPQGYALWVKEETVDAYGRRTAVHRSAQPIETRVLLVSRPGIEDSPGWCRAYDLDVRYVPEIPEGEVPLTCFADGLAAIWTRTTATAPCTFVEERYEAMFTCGTPPAWNCPGS